MSRHNAILLWGILLPVVCMAVFASIASYTYYALLGISEKKELLYQSFREAQDFVNNNEKVLPDKKDFVDKFENFKKDSGKMVIAKINELRMTPYGEVKIGNVDKESNSGGLTASSENIAIELNGYSGSIMDMCQNIENQMPFVYIDSINIKPLSRDATNPLPLNAQLKLKTISDATKTP